MLMVTGATGYLGRALVAQVLHQGREARVTTRDARAARRVLPPDVDVVEVGLHDGAGLRRAARGCSAVVHLAGAVGGSADETHRTNVEGTRTVLAAAMAVGVPRFVHTSSSAAIMDASGLVAEEPVAPPALTDAYSASKTAAEEVVLGASGIEAMIVNPVNVYGPSPRGPLSYNGLFLAAARGEIAEIVDAPVGWVLAEDAAGGLLLAVDRGRPGRRYVLCGEVAPFGRVLHTFAGLVGGVRVPTLPPGSRLGRDTGTFARRSEVYGSFPAVRVDDRGARGLGFAPAGVDEGIARTAAWIGAL